MQNIPEQVHNRVGASHAIAPNPNERAAQVLHFPIPMIRDMETYAAKVDKSVSWCIRMAWSIACAELADGSSHAKVQADRMLRGDKQRLRVELPLSTWFHVVLEAERLDRSRSWLLQRAWMLARPRLLNAMR